MSAPYAGYSFNVLKSFGWSDDQAAAIVGNFEGESGLNPAAVGDGGQAYGIAQWHADRQAIFQQRYGRSIRGSSLAQQLNFANYELRYGNETAAGKRLMATGNVNDATYAVMRGYERPANDSSYSKRLAAAQSVLGKASSVAGSLVNGAVSSLGGGESGISGIFDSFKTWLAESHFWQRVGIAIMALIIIGGAIYMLGNKSNN